MKAPVRILASLLLALTVSCSVDYGFHKDIRTTIEQGISTEADLSDLFVSGGEMSPFFNPREYSYSVNTASDDVVSLKLTEGAPGQTLEYSMDGGTTYVPIASGDTSPSFDITTVYDGTLIIRVTNAAGTNHRVYHVDLNRTRLVMFHEQRNDANGISIRTELYVTYGEPFAFAAPTGTLIRDGITTLFDKWTESADGSGASFGIGETRPFVTTQLNYYAQWKTVGGTGPAGGIVVYDDPVQAYGFQYLEMAGIINGGMPIRWSSTIISPTTSNGLGQGQVNTASILAAITTDEGAAVACYTYEQNGFSGWFLPSFNELDAAKSFLSSDVYIWTSTRADYNAYAIRKGSDTIYSQTAASAYVRPFRSF